MSFSAAGSTDPDGDPLSYAWDLDNDGAFDDATGVTASGTYNGVGPKTARVRVTDGRGGSATKSTTVTVTNRPRRRRSRPTRRRAPPRWWSFSASGSTDPDGTALTYAWDPTTTGVRRRDRARHAQAYNAVGQHVVTVRVTDADGGSATQAVTVTVTNSGPTARITTTPSPATGNAPLLVSFSGSTSSDPDGGTLTYAWDLDSDGQYDDGTQPPPAAPTASAT